MWTWRRILPAVGFKASFSHAFTEKKKVVESQCEPHSYHVTLWRQSAKPKIKLPVSLWRPHHAEVILPLQERISQCICIAIETDYCYAAERTSWVFDWSRAWGFTVFLPWKGSICCLIQGFQGSNNREETTEAVSAPVLINKNNPFPLLAWFAASSFTPTLCSYQKYH